MKISRISVYQVDLPLEYPYWLSGGRLKFECLDATLVKIETDEGHVGWGEGTPWGHTMCPHGPGIRAGIETMAPFIMGLDRAACWTWNVLWTLLCQDIFMQNHQLTWPVGTSRGKARACRSPI